MKKPKTEPFQEPQPEPQDQVIPEAVRPKKEIIPCKYVFTNSDKLELGNKLAEANNKLSELDDERKRVTSDYKARMDGIQADVNLLSGKISNGYETRMTECFVEMHPGLKEKYYVNAQTFVIECVKAMQPGDFQAELPIG